ncbi:MAG: DUF2252 family protein [Candidatus Sericytochromatia bacterium]|nr:DUF2252 family protein [Candidatus Sericytochromatia bacterium]
MHRYRHRLRQTAWLIAMLAGLSGCGTAIARPSAGPVPVLAQGTVSVRDQVLTDNERRRTVNPDGYARKLAKLSEAPYSFFRGTSPLFYRRLFAALPASLRAAPAVIVHGDLHLENFTALPGADGVYYGIDDFDESLPGPASIDLIRCLSSIVVAYGDDESLLGAFLDGYRQGTDGRMATASVAITKLIRKQSNATQAEMLAKRTTATRPRQMKPGDATKALTPAQQATLQAAVAAGKLGGLDGLPCEDAVQRFAGTASLDLFRFEGVFGNGGDRDRIVEIKELLPSVLAGHLGTPSDDGARYRQAVRQFQGAAASPVSDTTFGNYRMLIRYRAACKDTVSPEDVGPGDRQAFLTDLGKITGAAHTRSGRGGALATFVDAQRALLIRTAQRQGNQSLNDYKAFGASRR